MFGVYLGEFPADICSKCGESFTDQVTTRKIEEIARHKRDKIRRPNRNVHTARIHDAADGTGKDNGS